MVYRYLILVALALQSVLQVTAQTATEEKSPSAVLVQLPSERNRLEAFQKHKYNVPNTVAEERDKIFAVTIADFRDHFDYCPVYYFMDTNVDAVINKQFNGVLLDTNLKPAQNIIINSSSSKYLVVYYGRPLAMYADENVIKDSATEITRQPITYGEGLVICNSKLQQLTYFYKLWYDEAWYKLRKDATLRSSHKYDYASKQFKMEYFPFAAKLQRALERRASLHDADHEK